MIAATFSIDALRESQPFGSEERPTLAFVLYDSRSGSTMLAALLNQYRSVGVSHENSVVTHILEHPGSLETPEDVERLVQTIRRDPVDRELGLEAEDYRTAFLDAGLPLTPADAIAAFADLYFETHRSDDVSVRVIKHPPYRHLGTIRRLFPEARFIHLVRDGRAVLASKRTNRGLEGRSMERSVAKAALDWKRKLAFAEGVSGVCTVRYEDLVVQPKKEVGHILEFLGLPSAEQEIVRSQEAYSRAIGHKQQALHTRVGAAPSGASVARWTESLTPQEQFAYEHIAGPALRRYGYPLQSPSAHRGWQALALAKAWGHYAYVRATNFAYTLSRPQRLKRRVQALRATTHSARG